MEYLTKKGIIDSFRKCGIQPGSVLMLHTDSIFLAQTRPMPKEDRYALFFEVLDEVIGPEGTNIIPTFTYSATNDEPFIIEETPSTVGGFTEYFRKQPGVLRSKDPIFSVATRGAKAKEFAHAEVGDAFGAKSVFGLLDRYNAWIACLACSLDQITYTHYIEQNFGVDYRYFKYFQYVIHKNKKVDKGLIRYFVRDLSRQTNLKLDYLKKRLKITKVLKEASIGRFSLNCIKSFKFKAEANNLLQQNNNSLILEGNLQKTHSRARNKQIIK